MSKLSQIMYCLSLKNIFILSLLLRPTICLIKLNKLDVNICKVSHFGLSFTGTVSKTAQGSRCRRWDAKVHTNMTDDDFPDLSIRKAENYCRNPTKDADGPWCYTGGKVLVKQRCNVPLCASQCLITGPGMEYAGTVAQTTHQKCEKWNQNWHKRRVKMPSGIETFGVAHPTDRFPDKNVESARNYCRNPDGSLGGPWCYTKSDKNQVFVKNYCDIPVCHERTNEFISKQKDFYSHFISYGSSEGNITLDARLWNPDREHNASIKILLSVLNTPTSIENMQAWSTAIEVTISNHGTGVTIGNISQFREPTSELLKATEYTSFIVSWKNNVLNLYMSRDATESVYMENFADSPILLAHGLSIRHYSVSGNVAVWAFSPHDDDTCQEHTTFLPSPLFAWKLRQDGVQFYLEIFVRSFHSAVIFLTPDPYYDYPRLSIKIGFPESVTEVVYEPAEMVRSVVLASTNFSIDYWSWTRLRITLLGNEMRMMRYKEGSFLSLLASSHEIANSLKWFSIGSNESLSHWALFCEPLDIPTAYPPNCALTAAALDYKGDQSVSHSGLPCLPWFAVEPRFYEGALELNYCRNYRTLRSSPWCYVQVGATVKPETCNVRKCNAGICKKAGTANDYVGDLAVTRSNFTCKKWPRSYRKSLKNEMYPSNFFEGNFCRNPTRDVGGAWCFTTDTAIKKDLCDVKDCDKSESRILIITKQRGNLRHTYILPSWRSLDNNAGLHFSLKRWDPSLPEGALFKIFSIDKRKLLELYIGAKYNEELILRYVDNKTNTSVLLVRKIFPHIIPGGKWCEFRLQMYSGGIRLGYETKNYTILDWKADKPSMTFNPSFVSYGSIGTDVIGIYFPHRECHVENTSAPLHSSIYPISWQNEQESSTNLTLHLRGTGVAIIPLVHFPSQTEDYLVVFIDDTKKLIYLENNTVLNATKLCTTDLGEELISDTKWNRYDIYSMNNSLFIHRNKIQLIKWDAPSALVYYFFSLAVRRGWVVWTANCPPPDIDSPLQDGGWSAWSDWRCSVSCEKGVGYRRRECDNPKPTIFGNPCTGSSVETGVCNDFSCDKISPQTYNLLRKDLQTKCFNIIAQEGDNVIFESPLKLMKRIKTESSSSRIIWMHNGTTLKSKEGKYYYNDSLAVTVKNISQDDNGVYVCVVKSNIGVNTPIKVTVITVEPLRPDVVIYNGSSFDLACSSALATIYADLWIKWYLNDELFSATDIATVYFKNTLRIPIAHRNHSGIWKCVMEQTDLNLRWVVQIYKVLVIEEPSLLTRSVRAYTGDFLDNLLQCDEPILISFITTGFICLIFLVVGGIICKICQKANDEKMSGTEEPMYDLNITGTNTDCPDTHKLIINTRDRRRVMGHVKSKQRKRLGFKFEILGKGERFGITFGNRNDEYEDTHPSNDQVGVPCPCMYRDNELINDNDGDDDQYGVDNINCTNSTCKFINDYIYDNYEEDDYEDCDVNTCLYKEQNRYEECDDNTCSYKEQKR